MDVKRTIREIHHRSLWQVLAIYLGTSWFVLQIAEHVVKQFGLADWTYGMALLLLLVGLPIVLATAFVQEGPPRADHAPDDPPGAETSPPRQGGTSRSLFTWRNALGGAVGAAALWGIVAAGWLLVAPGRSEETETPRLAQITAAGEDAEFGEDGELAEQVEFAEDGVRREGETGRNQDVAAATEADDANRRARPARDVEPASQDDTGTAARRQPVARGGCAAALAHPEVERERRDYVELREMAARAAEQARAAGAVERGVDLSSPDSLFEAARAAAGQGDLRRAQRDLASASALYADAARRAETAWRTAADSAARAVDSLRARAGSAAEGYREGESRRQQAETAAGGGDFRRAVELLREASSHYERARAAPAETAAGRDVGGGGDAPDAEVREVVTEVLARLRRALESRDLEALRRVWVTMDPASDDGFERFFDRIRDFEVEIDVRWETLVASESRVAVTGVTTWRYYDERLRRPATREPFEQAFELVRRDAEWVLIRY